MNKKLPAVKGTNSSRAQKESSVNGRQIELEHLTLDSMLMDLPSHNKTASPDTPGQVIADLFVQEPLLPGVIILKKSELSGMISRDQFFQSTGKLYGTEIFLVRPIQKMLATIPSKPLILPETTLISLATKAALSREKELIYQPIIIEKQDHTFQIISAQLLFMAQSHQLLKVHNQRLYTVESGQKISTKKAIIRFIAHVGNKDHFALPMFVKRHSIRCNNCGKLVNYSIVDIVRSFVSINQGVIVEEKMGMRTYRLYIRHRCNGELWEIPVHHDENLEYRSQRGARIVETYV